MNLDGYLTALGQLPSYDQTRMAALQIRNQQQQNQQNQFELAEKQDASNREQAFRTEIKALGPNSTPEQMRAFAIRYPEFSKPINEAATGLEKQRQTQLTSDYTQFGAVLSGKKPRVDLAKGIIQRHIDADKAAGRPPDPGDLAMMAALDSGDPSQIEDARNLAYGTLAAINPEVSGKLDAAANRDNFASTGDNAIYDKRTGEVVRKGTPRPQYRTIGVYDANGVKIGDRLIEVGGDEEGGGRASGGKPGAVAPPVDGSGKFDARKFFKEFVLPHEGGYSASDANGSPVNMGINQAANPGVDVRTLTPDQAADIFVTKYAPKAANLPPVLAAVYADTAYINPARAEQFLKASGGDPAKFLQMRRAWQNNLVAKEPGKYGRFAKAWTNRNNDLAGYIGDSQAQPTPPAKNGSRVVYESVGQPATPGGAPGYQPGTPVGGMSAEAIDRAAQRYNLTGALPVGLGRKGDVQRAILSRAAQLASGDTGAQIGDQAGRKADTSALVALETKTSNIMAFERGAVMNGTIALRLSDKVGNGGVPILNKWINAGRRETGDPDVAAFNAAVTTFADEYAKIVTSATGGGAGTSDSARQHVYNLINTAQSPAQFRSVMSVLRADMTNRRRGIEAERAAIQARISGSGGGAAGAPIKVKSIQQARALPPGTVFIDPNGVRRVR